MWEKKVTLKSGKTKLINHCGEIYFSSVHLQPIQNKKRKGNISKIYGENGGNK